MLYLVKFFILSFFVTCSWIVGIFNIFVAWKTYSLLILRMICIMEFCFVCIFSICSLVIQVLIPPIKKIICGIIYVFTSISFYLIFSICVFINQWNFPNFLSISWIWRCPIPLTSIMLPRYFSCFSFLRNRLLIKVHIS